MPEGITLPQISLKRRSSWELDVECKNSVKRQNMMGDVSK